MKLCVNCRHSVDRYATLDACARNVRTRINMQDGSEIKTGWRTASLERTYGWVMARLAGTCGEEGRFWEAKP